MDDNLLISLFWIPEIFLLITGGFAFYDYFFNSKNINSLILGIFLTIFFIFGIIWRIIKKESFLSQER